MLFDSFQELWETVSKLKLKWSTKHKLWEKLVQTDSQSLLVNTRGSSTENSLTKAEPMVADCIKQCQTVNPVQFLSQSKPKCRKIKQKKLLGAKNVENQGTKKKSAFFFSFLCAAIEI